MIVDLLQRLGIISTDKKYMSPEQIGRHYGPEAQAAAEKREREREEREDG